MKKPTRKNPKALAGANGSNEQKQLNLFKTNINPKSIYFLGTDNPRHIRVLKALAKFKEISRTSIDEIAGASNGPELLAELRRRGLGEKHLKCERRERLDRDGRPCRPGYYSLSPEGKKCIGRWLFKNGHAKGGQHGG